MPGRREELIAKLSEIDPAKIAALSYRTAIAREGFGDSFGDSFSDSFSDSFRDSFSDAAKVLPAERMLEQMRQVGDHVVAIDYRLGGL
jgi:hypothetical protein